MCSELKPWQHIQPNRGDHALDSAKSAFGHPVKKNGGVLENPGVSDVLEPTQHHC